MTLEPITLSDAASGATASILPGFGFNCYSLRLAPQGNPIELLWSAEDILSGQARPSHSGIPVLFPFAGRLHGSHLVYQGHTYPLGSDDGLGNAIHGFVLKAVWRVTEYTDRRAVGEFHAAVDEPGLIRRWPADFRLIVAYELFADRLAARIEVLNPGGTTLPFGLGLHPYFRLPLGSAGSADDCRVTVPASEYWHMQNMLPDGSRLPADGPRGLSRGMRFADSKLDDIFTSLAPFDGRFRASIEDPANSRRLHITFDQCFQNCVVYNPPHRQAICIEPYTTVPDSFALWERGVETGLVLLEPGATWHAAMEIELASL